MSLLRSFEDLVLELCDAAVHRVQWNSAGIYVGTYWKCSVCGVTGKSPVLNHENACAVKLVKEKLQEEKV